MMYLVSGMSLFTCMRTAGLAASEMHTGIDLAQGPRVSCGTSY